MSHLKSVCLIAAVVSALLLPAGVAPAGDSPGQQETVQPRMLEAAIQNGEIVGWEQVRRVFVTCGTNEFVFVAPYGLRIDANPAMVTVVSADSTYFLTFRILRAADADPNLENLDSYRELVFNRFPGAKVVEEYSKSAAGRNGPAFELRVKIASGVERAVWVALIPSAAGVLEFTLNADLSKSTDAKQAFNSGLRTFRSNENGKLEITTRVLDQS
jgi:hypothetical protein